MHSGYDFQFVCRSFSFLFLFFMMQFLRHSKRKIPEHKMSFGCQNWRQWRFLLPTLHGQNSALWPYVNTGGIGSLNCKTVQLPQCRTHDKNGFPFHHIHIYFFMAWNIWNTEMHKLIDYTFLLSNHNQFKMQEWSTNWKLFAVPNYSL